MLYKSERLIVLGTNYQPMELEDAKKEIARLKAENEKLTKKVTFKVSEKGAVSMYGLGRFPVTLYKEQWEKVFENIDNLKAFIEEHDAKLATK